MAMMPELWWRLKCISAFSLALPRVGRIGIAAAVACVISTLSVRPSLALTAKEWPQYLPSYFAPAFQGLGDKLHQAEHLRKGPLEHSNYITADQVVSLSLDRITCDRATCPTVFWNAAQYLSTQATPNAGLFRAMTASELWTEWQTGLGNETVFAFRLPQEVLIWSYATRLARDLKSGQRFETLQLLADRERFEETRGDNVEAGTWEVTSRTYAEALLKQGDVTGATMVLKAVVAVAPNDFPAQLELAENSTDRAAARRSEQAVFDNAESPEYTERAAHLLGVAEPRIGSLPILTPGQSGLRLILIPLPPCDVRLLMQAADLYRETTGIPTEIRRLPEPWTFGPPDRVLNQGQIRAAIEQMEGPATDFTGWTAHRYAEALMRTVATKDVLSQFEMQQFVAGMLHRPGQYNAVPYLDRLLSILAQYRTTDRRTMFVGVTDANIYAGSANFLFSEYGAHDGAGASLLSYAMMQASTLKEPFESRRRLAERLAKEMVPASLKSLGIPRPVDPSDPYSYSDGIARLDQKTLVLSEPTKSALAGMR